MATLTENEIDQKLSELPKWHRSDQTIVRQFEFKNFPEAIAFVDRLAVEAEEAFHHPDIDIRWNKVHLTLTTHDQGGLTVKDFDLAAAIDRLL